MVFEISIFPLTVDNLPFNCDQCYKTNSSKKGLTQHMWIKQYPTTDHTKRHMKIYTIKNPYHCFLCATKSIYRSHMKSHARENMNPYALCWREVITRNHSKRHSKRIIEQNLYHCTLCSKGLISRNHTKRHMKSHARRPCKILCTANWD